MDLAKLAASPKVPTIDCALVVTRRAHREVLLVGSEMEYRLPSLEIPRWERPAPHINDNVKRFWGIESVCLFAASAACGSGSEGARRCYVLEARAFGPASRDDSTWISVGDLRSSCATVVKDAPVLISALDEVQAYETNECACHFVRSGWFEEVTAWVSEQVSHHGGCLSGHWAQFTMGPDFALIRFETTGSAVWFKAAGGRRTMEYATTLALAEMASPYLPELIGDSAEWQSWLMVDAGGCRLEESDHLRAWTTAASSLAALQIDSVNSIERLIAAGCHDCRASELERMIDPFIAEVARLMAAQPHSPPQILTDKELRTVAACLHEGCALLESLPILPCLGHGDLNTGNIIVDENKAVFLDWAAGMVGHPFFSCEYLLALFRRLHPERAAWASAICSAYLLPWRRICSGDAIEKSLARTPLVAPFAWALRLWETASRTRGTEAYTARLLRSVARRIHGEASLLAGKGSLSICEERR